MKRGALCGLEGGGQKGGRYDIVLEALCEGLGMGLWT